MFYYMQLNILFQGGSSLQQQQLAMLQQRQQIAMLQQQKQAMHRTIQALQQERLLEEEAFQEVHNYSTYLLYCDGTSQYQCVFHIYSHQRKVPVMDLRQTYKLGH